MLYFGFPQESSLLRQRQQLLENLPSLYTLQFLEEQLTNSSISGLGVCHDRYLLPYFVYFLSISGSRGLELLRGAVRAAEKAFTIKASVDVYSLFC
jgi:hypothetical protein